jgi:F420-non-reducing hydrogenase iron-sulfur subunit
MSGSTGGGSPDFRSPRILVFSTNTISDPGIDLAGSSHLHYPATVTTISLPCTSALKPAWVVRALDAGFDGVFIASDGEECAYLPDCARRSSRMVGRAQELLAAAGRDPRRVKLAAVCSVCAQPFTTHLREFSEVLRRLDPNGRAVA